MDWFVVYVSRYHLFSNAFMRFSMYLFRVHVSRPCGSMFCACGSGSTCVNPFSTKTSVTDVKDNRDTSRVMMTIMTMIMTSSIRRH